MPLVKSQDLGAAPTGMRTAPTSDPLWDEKHHDLATQVRDFIFKSFPLARKRQIKNSDALLESGVIDSQGVLEVVAFIEGEYFITVEDEELSPENFQTIDRIAAFIQSKASHDDSGSREK